MRLLLLLSALLSALTGVAGNRAVAQPIVTSITASTAATRPAVARAAFVGVPLVATPTKPPRLAGSRLVSAVIVRVLYAERRRE